MSTDTIRKVFISYSWTSDAYRKRVEKLVEDLATRGVLGVADFNALRPGEDKYVFMERCVNDPEIIKVLCVVDRRYTERFNARKGGIGTEAVILTPSLYEGQEAPDGEDKGVKVKVNRIIPVVYDVDEEGQPVVLPTALDALIHVDLSTETAYIENITQLEHAIFDEPLLQPPRVIPRQPRPPTDPTAWWGSLPETIRSSIDQDRLSMTRGRLEDLYRKFVEHFRESYAVPVGEANDAQLIRFRNHASSRSVLVGVWNHILQYMPEALDFTVTRRFFEQLLVYSKGQNPFGFMEGGDEHIRLAIADLFLHLVGLLLSRGQYSLLEAFLSATYAYSLNRAHEIKKGPFSLIQNEVSEASLPWRELYGGVLAPSLLTLDELRNADLLLGVHHHLHHWDAPYERRIPTWWPVWVTSAGRRDNDAILSNIFTTRTSIRELQQLAHLLGFETLDELKERVQASQADRKRGYAYAWFWLNGLDAVFAK